MSIIKETPTIRGNTGNQRQWSSRFIISSTAVIAVGFLFCHIFLQEFCLR